MSRYFHRQPNRSLMNLFCRKTPMEYFQCLLVAGVSSRFLVHNRRHNDEEIRTGRPIGPKIYDSEFKPVRAISFSFLEKYCP